MFPEQPLAINVAVSLVHKFVLLVLIKGANGLVPVLITTELLDTLSLQALLQVALYVPLMLTVMLPLVAPVIHLMFPEQPLATNVAVSLAHKLVLLVLIKGAAGLVTVLITTELLAPLSPQVLLQVALYVPMVVTLIEF